MDYRISAHSRNLDRLPRQRCQVLNVPLRTSTAAESRYDDDRCRVSLRLECEFDGSAIRDKGVIPCLLHSTSQLLNAKEWVDCTGPRYRCRTSFTATTNDSSWQSIIRCLLYPGLRCRCVSAQSLQRPQLDRRRSISKARISRGIRDGRYGSRYLLDTAREAGNAKGRSKESGFDREMERVEK